MSVENAGTSICRRDFSQGSYSNIIFPLKAVEFDKSVITRTKITTKTTTTTKSTLRPLPQYLLAVKNQRFEMSAAQIMNRM